jgi:ABC-type sugar transport system ATPase subunit
LFGLARGQVSGTVSLSGQEVAIGRPRDALSHGIAFLPEDRKGLGLVTSMSVADNMHLAALRSRLVDPIGLERDAAALARSLSIKVADVAHAVTTLSGGNQQKVALARGLVTEPRVLLLDEPTRGVDVGARGEMYRLIRQQAEAGIAVLFVSSDMAEILTLAERVVVLRDGRVVGELQGEDIKEESILRLTVGGESAEKRAS